MHPSYGSKEKGLEESFGSFPLVISSQGHIPHACPALACHQQLDSVLNRGKRKRDVQQGQKFGEKAVGE